MSRDATVGAGSRAKATRARAELRPLAFSCGDPAGVGPIVSVRAALSVVARGHEERVRLFGDGAQLAGLLRKTPAEHRRRIEVTSVSAVPAAALRTHEPAAITGAAALAALDAARAATASGACRAIVTAPVSKYAITLSGAQFVGQTEHLAAHADLASDAVTMMFLGPHLKVALVTTHLALREVPRAITRARVMRTIAHLGEAMIALGAAPGARVVVTGVNPHAGEDGLFGDEEPRVVSRAVAWGRTTLPYKTKALELVGPIGAETAFREAKAGLCAGVVAMFHDQATIASKLLDWGDAVNVTWGLPYVRTSVDHGVGWDAARSGDIDDGGMIAAARLAQTLTLRAARPRP